MAAVILPAAFLAVSLGGTAQAGPAVQCGSTLAVDTTLTTDLFCASGDGLTLAPNVALNLGGHTLTGSGAFTVGITTSIADGGNTIRNGQLKNWGTGVVVGGEGSTPATSKLSNVVLRSAATFVQDGGLTMTKVVAVGSPVSVSTNGNVSVSNSSFTRSGLDAYVAFITIDHSSLTASPLSTVSAGGITVDRSKLDGKGTTSLGFVSETGFSISNSDLKNFNSPIAGYYGGATLTNNSFKNMPNGVVGDLRSNLDIPVAFAIVKGNSFTNSGVVLDPKVGMIVENNTFTRNDTGAIFAESQVSSASGNTFTKNTGTGIRSDVAGLKLSNNKATLNGGYGIYAPGAIDLGGNVAYKNKLGQCVGLTCAAK